MGFFPASTLLGMVLMVASLSLFVVSKVKPNLHEESDNIYAAVGVICALFLLASTDLSAAMALQQFLLLPATITLMWQFIKLRAENKQLKNRQPGTERAKSGYNARLEDDYLETPRERRQGKRRRDMSYEDDERRLLGDRQESAVEPMLSRSRSRSFDAETTDGDRYGESGDRQYPRRRSNREDEDTDWSDNRPNPRTAQRALPDADLVRDRSPQRFDRDREDGTARFSPDEDRGWNEAEDTSTTSEFGRDNLNEDPTPRRRKRPTRPDRDDDRQQRPTDSRSAKGSMTAYVNYEPVDPEAGLPPSGTEEPIVFPDRY